MVSNSGTTPVIGSKGQRKERGLTWVRENPYKLTTLCLLRRIGVADAAAPSGMTSVGRFRRAKLPTLTDRRVSSLVAVDEGGSFLLPGCVAVWLLPPSSDSLLSSGPEGAQAMMKTPAKVAPQP